MAFFSTIKAAMDFIGRGDSYAAKKIAEKLVYASGADTPSNTSTVPTFIGQYYLDTANSIWYKAVGTSAASDFKALNS